MSQYQMHPINATIRRFCLALAVVWTCLLTGLPGAKIATTLAVQNIQATQSHLLLLPLGDTPVELLTHTVDVRVSIEGDHSLRMDIAASYRLHNPQTADSTLLVQVNGPSVTQPVSLLLPDALALESDGQPLALQPTGNGLQQTAQIGFGPDARRSLLLRYTLRFGAVDLPAFVYPASELDVWPGQVTSWRITLTLDDPGSGPLGPDSWLTVEPAGWSYTGNRLQWLSEAAFPDQPVRWQLIHPARWQEIQAIRQRIGQQPAATDSLALGNIYRNLYAGVAGNAGNRERFYDQALSAYADGLPGVGESGAAAQSVAALHQALAALYRSRSIGADGRVDPAYVELMVAEAEAALAYFPGEAVAARREVVGWLADGLRLQSRQAQQRKDWPAALGLLERLAALPDGVVDPDQLAEERRLLLLEQALQFLSQRDADAALALAGPSLAMDALLPGAERQALFVRWDFSLTIHPEGVELKGVAAAIPGRQDEARRQVEQIGLAWGALSLPPGRAQISFDGERCTVTVNTLTTNERVALVQATPQNTHWALLRTLLVNAEAEKGSTGHLIWQTTTIHYSLDLRPVADQWNGIGASLARDSLAMERTDSTEERIRGELSAITHRQEAERWQALAAGSRVDVALAASAQAGIDARRLWSVQLTDSPQPLALVSQSVSLLRLLIAGVLAMLLLFALAGILWLLL